MSLIVSSALAAASGDLVPTSFESTLHILARANFDRITAPSRLLETEDVVSVHRNPETGEVKLILERRAAEATWGALLTAYKLIRRADQGRRDTPFVSEESLQKVGLRQPPLDWIVKNLTDANPLLYPGTFSEVFRTYYSAQRLVGDLTFWMAQCQVEASNLEADGIQSGWDWKSALNSYVIPPHRPYHFRYPEDSFESYNPRLPTFDPRLIRGAEREAPMEDEDRDEKSSSEWAVVLHPTESHYSRHFPHFDPFSGQPQEELNGCLGRESCFMEA
ncbi:hypothetical protein C8R42DRAFT_724674 [Lentinula raphanica]|nr:hypothetical protein C8R42DRAFT_724674 [Lentinula raphanica]